jgi:hypothetical protein
MTGYDKYLDSETGKTDYDALSALFGVSYYADE